MVAGNHGGFQEGLAFLFAKSLGFALKCFLIHSGEAGPCAARAYEPRQVRKEAAVNGYPWVPQECLVSPLTAQNKKSGMRSNELSSGSKKMASSFI